MKYTTRSFVADECSFEERTTPTITILVDDDFVDTKLVNADGRTLYRVRPSVGFVRHR